MTQVFDWHLKGSQFFYPQINPLQKFVKLVVYSHVLFNIYSCNGGEMPESIKITDEMKLMDVEVLAEKICKRLRYSNPEMANCPECLSFNSNQDFCCKCGYPLRYPSN